MLYCSRKMKLSLSSLEAKVARETYFKRRGHEEDYQKVMVLWRVGGVSSCCVVGFVGSVALKPGGFPRRNGIFPGRTVGVHIHPLPRSPDSSGDGPFWGSILAPTDRNIYRSEKWRKTLTLSSHFKALVAMPELFISCSPNRCGE